MVSSDRDKPSTAGSGSRTLDVGIVGAGFSGAAAALFLARAGHVVTLYESVPEPRPVGAGILLQPTGMAALERLGLCDAVLARSARVTHLRARTASGWGVLDLSYSDIAPGLFGGGLHRGALFEALLGAARAEERITVRCGVHVDAVSMQGGSRPCILSREFECPHDLIVVADGARSQVRVEHGVVRRVDEYPWGALWLVLEDNDGLFGNELHQVVDGTRTMLGFLPTGTGPPSLVGNRSLVSLFWSIRMDAVEDFRRGSLEAWKHRLTRLDPRAESLTPQIEDFDQLLCASYRDVRMWPYHAKRVVYLGDAAHAMSPQLGQGANLGLTPELDRQLKRGATVPLLPGEARSSDGEFR